MIVVGIVAVFAIVVGWPAAGYLLGSVCAPRPEAPDCPHCGYDRSEQDDGEACPECGLTRDEAARALPPSPAWRKRWWFYVPLVSGILALCAEIVLGSHVPYLAGLSMLTAIVAYLSILAAASKRMVKRDRRLLILCWMGVWLLASAGAAVGFLSEFMTRERSVGAGFVIMSIMMAALMALPASGVGVFAASVVIWRRWRVPPARPLGSTLESVKEPT